MCSCDLLFFISSVIKQSKSLFIFLFKIYFSLPVYYHLRHDLHFITVPHLDI